VLRSVCVVGLALAGLVASGAVQAADNLPAKRAAAPAFLGLIAGPAACSETLLAADMASLFPQGDLSILPILGDAGAVNLARLEGLKADIAFVSTDVLAEASAKDESLHERLELVTRLAPQEVHVLARADIGKLPDLAGRKVNFGPPGSASAITAAALFKALQIEVEASSLDITAAIEHMKDGALAAMVVVGGKPSPIIGAIPPNAGIHLLPVSFGVPLEAAYLPTRLASNDYPNLIEPGAEVPTVATGLVLLAVTSDDGSEAAARVARFVETVFPRFAELQAQGHHPKWREVNLAASLTGFKRNAAAASWLLEKQDRPQAPATANAKARAKKAALTANADASQGAPVPSSLLNSKQQMESLFERFNEWRRGNER
jgi:TRAP transporter TAXI family solute receptor